MEKIKTFLRSRPLKRFYRIVGFGIVSLVLVSLVDLIPQLNLNAETQGFIMLLLTGALNSVDKLRRDLKKVE